MVLLWETTWFCCDYKELIPALYRRDKFVQRRFHTILILTADHKLSVPSRGLHQHSFPSLRCTSLVRALDVADSLKHYRRTKSAHYLVTRRVATICFTEQGSTSIDSRYPTNTFGFSVAGKWPTPFIALCLPPVILSQVAWPMAGVLLQSYSPVSMYTGHFLVSMLDMRLRPSQPPVSICMVSQDPPVDG